MPQGPQITWLPDAKRLHLNHGPMDMIVGVSGPGRNSAFDRAARRFETLLDDLVTDLPRLRTQDGPLPTGDSARRMIFAVDPFHPAFITPMAAVAGAGADTILRAICDGPGIDKAYVNNGGDVAFHIVAGQTMRAAIAGDPSGTATLTHTDPVRGIATSGWQGRSHSLGIADSVTVLAATAAMADAAATMIANEVNLLDHSAITRQRASDLAPDSDLGDRLVTIAVGVLRRSEVAQALEHGAIYARGLMTRNLIHSALLTLRGATRTVGPLPLIQQKDPVHA